MTRRLPLLILGALLALGACSKNDRTARGSGDAAEAPSVSDAGATAGDPCGLLDVKQVEAAIGPLRDPPYRFNDRENLPDAAGSICVYQAKDLRRMTLDVDWTDGAMGMKMVRDTRALTDKAMSGKMVTESGDTISGAWDEVAPMPMNCCILEALLGDRLATLNWTGTRLTTAEAARLLDAAVQRLDHPLSIDGAAPVAAVAARLAAEPKDRDPCSLVTREEAEVILGPLTAAPLRSDSGKGNACTYVFKMENFPASTDMKVYWTRGYEAFAGEMHVQGLVGSRVMPRLTDSLVKGTEAPPPGIPGPWDEAGDGAARFLAVRHDVMIEIDRRIVKLPQAEALATKAFSKLP